MYSKHTTEQLEALLAGYHEMIGQWVRSLTTTFDKKAMDEAHATAHAVNAELKARKQAATAS